METLGEIRNAGGDVLTSSTGVIVTVETHWSNSSTGISTKATTTRTCII
jgi:hypothetical protein